MKYLHIFESYNSQKELEVLIKHIKNFIINYIINENDTNLSNISLDMKDLKLNSDKFKNLNGFINLDLNICFNLSSNLVARGYYNKKLLKIVLFYTVSESNQLLNIVNNDKNISTSNKIDIFFERIFTSTLLHELQHAFDDFRSSGKSIKQTKNFFDKTAKYFEIKRKITGLQEEEREFINSFYNEYLNLKHEVDARFTEAIKKTKFYDWSFEIFMESNEYNFEILPFQEVLNNFKENFYSFDNLTQKEKNRVLRKFGQFYELEKDLIKNNFNESDFL